MRRVNPPSTDYKMHSNTKVTKFTYAESHVRSVHMCRDFIAHFYREFQKLLYCIYQTTLVAGVRRSETPAVHVFVCLCIRVWWLLIHRHTEANDNTSFRVFVQICEPIRLEDRNVWVWSNGIIAFIPYWNKWIMWIVKPELIYRRMMWAPHLNSHNIWSRRSML